MTSDSTKVPLVFIHGFKGSRLVSPSGDIEWLELRQVLGLSHSHLKLPLLWNEDKQSEDGLKPLNILDSISLIPGVFKKNIYGVWLEAARNSQRPFYEFAYDWRRDNLENLAQFKSFIEDIQKKHQNKIQIVAHSMGGLITFAMMNDNPEWIHSVVFVGVPFKGGISFLEDMTLGTRTGLNSKILNPETLGSFPSVYTLFALNSKGLVFENNKEADFDFYNAEHWKMYKAGLFSSEEPEKEKMEFLSKALDRAKQFKNRILFSPISYPPIFVVSGNQFTAPEKVHFKRLIKEYVWDFSDRSAGDGRVCEKSSLPPAGVPYTLYHSQYEHAELLDDPILIEKIIKMQFN